MIENLTVDSRLVPSTDRVLWKGKLVREIKYNDNTVWKTDDFAVKLTDEATFIRTFSKFEDCRLGIDYYRITVNGTDYRFNRDADLVLPAATSLGFKIVNGNFWQSISFPENLEKDKWLLFKLDETVLSQTVTMTQGAMNDYSGSNHCQNHISHNASFRNFSQLFCRTAFIVTDQYGADSWGQYRDVAVTNLGTSYSGSWGWGRSSNSMAACYAYAVITTSVGTYRIDIDSWYRRNPQSNKWDYRSQTGNIEYGTYELIQTN